MTAAAARPELHFSARQGWLNDPNGLLFDAGCYHLFFQHHPASTRWGPMHWGHARSRDLLHWEELPIALTPGPLGMAFSGTAIIDTDNRAGFGAGCWIAAYTLHDAEAAAQPGSLGHQRQGLALSHDQGQHWTPWAGNPVLEEPELRDCRDPKLLWHAPSQAWVMLLAAGRELRLYRSADLRRWQLASRCTPGPLPQGAGVWECPDLLALPDGRWLLLLSHLQTEGGLRGHALWAACQFDGWQLQPEPLQRLDPGPDAYATQHWATPAGPVCIAWMSNWAYADRLPTEPWRGSMGLPTALSLPPEGLRRWPVLKPGEPLAGVPAQGAWLLQIQGEHAQPFSLQLQDAAGEPVQIAFDGAHYSLQRQGLPPEDGRFQAARRRAAAAGERLWLVVDAGSLELYADDGLAVISALAYPRGGWQDARLAPGSGAGLALSVSRCNSCIPSHL